MNKQTEETVANTLFPHLSQQVITITGNALSTAAIADLVDRGYHADTPRASVYDTLAKHIADHFSQPGELTATPQLIRECYFSEQFRNTASSKYPTINAEPFVSQHRAQLWEAELSINRALLPFVFQSWFHDLVNRVGGTPITRVGVVQRRRKPKSSGDHFEAIIYPNTAINAQDTCVWFLFDSILPPQRSQWAALVPASHPASALPAASVDLDPSAIILQSPVKAARLLIKSGLSRQKSIASTIQGALTQQPIQPLQNQTIPSQRPLLVQPQAIAPQVSQTPPHVAPRASTKDTKYIASAPAYDTALPWDLLADCTLEELLIYYPNHVLNWPGLALLFTHYGHRIVGQDWSHTATANRIDASRGIAKKYSNSRLRQFLLRAGTELISGYNPEEIQHYKSLYQLVQARAAANVSDLLQSLLQQPPSAFHDRLQPVTPLHEVGTSISGIHPVGHFASRVQTAMRAAQSGQAASTGTNTPTQLTQQGYHPMIDLLADRTRTWDERCSENTFVHNQTATEDRFIRPVELFGDLKSRKFRRKPDEKNGQIWEWTIGDQTVIDWLEENLTREELVQHHWRDLNRDAMLWLEMGYKNSDWVQFLTNAALKEFNVLDKTTEEDRRTAIIAYKARNRKAKQMALEARVKEVPESKWRPDKKTNSNASSHPHNKALYQEEKARFDEWAGKQRVKKPSAKRVLPDTTNVEFATKKRRINLMIFDSTPIAPTEVANDQDLIMEDIQAQVPLDDGLVALATPPLPCFDDESLYNINPDDGNVWVVMRQSEGNGSVPAWWRAARMQQMVESGIGFDYQLVTQLFDQGVDVGPNPSMPGQLFTIAGNFFLNPVPSPPPISPDYFALPPSNVDLDQDLSTFAYFPDSTFDPNLAFGDPTLLNIEPTVDTAELSTDSFFPFVGHDETAGFGFVGLETFNNTADALYDGGTVGTSAEQIAHHQTDTINGAIPDAHGEMHGFSFASPSRRRSPRNHQPEAPRRRSPRNHPASS
jgi:hypothetical protein